MALFAGLPRVGRRLLLVDALLVHGDRLHRPRHHPAPARARDHAAAQAHGDARFWEGGDGVVVPDLPHLPTRGGGTLPRLRQLRARLRPPLPLHAQLHRRAELRAVRALPLLRLHLAGGATCLVRRRAACDRARRGERGGGGRPRLQRHAQLSARHLLDLPLALPMDLHRVPFGAHLLGAHNEGAYQGDGCAAPAVVGAAVRLRVRGALALGD
mmetsp:Transcript_32552/g.75942  ORF Transcript_32552/g.75942 Transcript_32552/m.75942 type:complete len:213 (+) Transcript_32552:345-983(+)